jgi:hypothetical protein
MYLNAKMISVETTPGMGGWGWRRMVEEVNSRIIYLIHCKSLSKLHDVSPLIRTMKEKKSKALNSNPSLTKQNKTKNRPNYIELYRLINLVNMLGKAFLRDSSIECLLRIFSWPNIFTKFSEKCKLLAGHNVELSI